MKIDRQEAQMQADILAPLSSRELPKGVRARIVPDVNGLDMHVLEAGEQGATSALLLLHGFPELAFCWRKLMPQLAAAGYYVIAPDQRGYGRTLGAPVQYDDSIEEFSVLNLATDMVCLLGKLGLSGVEAVVGHDFGSVVAGVCALTRPDLFRRLALLSTPFVGSPEWGADQPCSFQDDPIHAELARLLPPRKHYQLYYCGREANEDMWNSKQGLPAFLRGYYHQKSADWLENNPIALDSWTAEQLARMPHYYCMPAESSMAEVVLEPALNEQSAAECQWLSERELATIAAEFRRTGFQGGLQWYRSVACGVAQRELSLFSGKRVDVPSIFVAGRADWGTYQVPGALAKVAHSMSVFEVGIHLVDGAGHWLQQEQPERLSEILLSFLHETD